MSRARNLADYVSTGVTSTELDKLDGLTATTDELNLVDGSVTGPLSHRNMIINGNFGVNQAGSKTGKTGEEKQMTGDRWTINMSGFGTWSGGTEADAPTGSGFRKSGYLNCTSAQASPGASAYCVYGQRFEGQDLQLIRKGTSSAKPITLSFWVKSPKTGIHICELYDGDNTRHCSQSYTIGTANTWEYNSVTFPADTTGAFDDDNDLSLYVQWWLGAGSNYTTGTLQTTWGTTTANRVVGQVNVADAVHSSNNYWQITGVQLELGSVATPFEHRSYADELVMCKRYYQEIFDNGSNYEAVSVWFHSGSGWSMAMHYPYEMRATPSGSFVGTAVNTGSGAVSTDKWSIYGVGAWRGLSSISLSSPTKRAVRIDGSTNDSLTAGQSAGLYSGTACYIRLNAEL